MTISVGRKYAFSICCDIDFIGKFSDNYNNREKNDNKINKKNFFPLNKCKSANTLIHLIKYMIIEKKTTTTSILRDWHNYTIL